MNDRFDAQRLDQPAHSLSAEMRGISEKRSSSISSMHRERQRIAETQGQPKKMEAALNDWLEKVEEQVNVLLSIA